MKMMVEIFQRSTRWLSLNDLVSSDSAPPTATRGAIPPPGHPLTDEQRAHLREYRREVRDTRMDRFLNDPEKAIKIFFSGYYRDRGMSG